MRTYSLFSTGAYIYNAGRKPSGTLREPGNARRIVPISGVIIIPVKDHNSLSGVVSGFWHRRPANAFFVRGQNPIMEMTFGRIV